MHAKQQVPISIMLKNTKHELNDERYKLYLYCNEIKQDGCHFRELYLFPTKMALSYHGNSKLALAYPTNGVAGSLAVLSSICTSASRVRYPVPVLYVQLVSSPTANLLPQVFPRALRFFLLH